MFCIKNPSELNRDWLLSRTDEENVVSIPVDVAKYLKNYHIMGIEFLYHNYRKGMKGSILNEDKDMNLPLQLAAFFRAVVVGPALILVICSRDNASYWHYHLSNDGNFEVIEVTIKNCKNSYKDNTKKLALILYLDCLNLGEEFFDVDFFSIVIENFDKVALKRNIKRLNGSFNVGLTHRSFYINPDQKLQWSMLNWANPGCVGKLNDFYEKDNKNVLSFTDNYRFWWLRLTWQFCESFQKPTPQETYNYQQKIDEWMIDKAFGSNLDEKKPKKRRCKKKEPVIPKTNKDDVPSENYIKLPSMDENPIVNSIIRNFEISPEPIVNYNPEGHFSSQANCSKYSDESSVCVSFLNDEQKPSTSRSESEEFILNLI